MKRSLMLGFLFILLSVLNPHLHAQDILKSHRITGLKNLKQIALVARFNDTAKLISVTEIDDLVTVALKLKIPDLVMSMSAEESDRWLEVNYVTDTHGMLIELTLYRWARIKDTGDDIFTPVWHESKFGVGTIDKKFFK